MFTSQGREHRRLEIQALLCNTAAGNSTVAANGEKD
jgi:hypothetical protein